MHNFVFHLQLSFRVCRIGHGGEASSTAFMCVQTQGHPPVAHVFRLVVASISQDNTSLKELDLWGNEIGDEGAKALAEMLKVSQSFVACVLTL